MLGLIFLKFADNKYRQNEAAILAQYQKLEGTRLFRGSANLSVQTLTKLARAVNSTLTLELVANDKPAHPPTWRR